MSSLISSEFSDTNSGKTSAAAAWLPCALEASEQRRFPKKDIDERSRAYSIDGYLSMVFENMH